MKIIVYVCTLLYVGDANEWLACKKQGEIFIEKKCSIAIPTLVPLVFLLSMSCPCLCYDCENISNEFQIYFETHFLLLETLLDRNKSTAHFPVKPSSRSEF